MIVVTVIMKEKNKIRRQEKELINLDIYCFFVRKGEEKKKKNTDDFLN